MIFRAATLPLLLCLVLSNLAMAAPAIAPPFKGEDRVLWDLWYTVTLRSPGGKQAEPMRYAYYNDRLELRKGRLFFKNQVWKKEEGFLNEEQLGAIAENGPELRPVMYNFHSNYRATETTIDGSMERNILTVVIRKGEQSAATLRKPLAPKSFFSVFFPVWLGFKADSLKPGTPVSFQTVLEDNVEAGTVSGTLRLDPTSGDEFAEKTKSRKLAVNYGNVKSFWWIDSTGAALRIEAPQQGRVVERVASKAVAEKFLEE